MTASSLGAGPAVAAFDIGGTDIKAAVFDESGAARGVTRVRTQRGFEGESPFAVQQVSELWQAMLRSQPEVVPRAVGLVAPGTVNERTGVCILSENLGWVDVPLLAHVERHIPVPVAFGHDVRAAGLAEHRLGAAAPYRDCAVMVIGTGIACAIFADGALRAADGYAGEIGHLIIDDAGPRCACGERGCLEAISSAGAIARLYEHATGKPVHGAREVLALATSGDATAVRVWDAAIDGLALGIASIVGVLGPEAVIIGGGLSQAGDALFEPLRTAVDRRIGGQRRPRIIPAAIGQDAGLVGAALGARDLLAHT